LKSPLAASLSILLCAASAFAADSLDAVLARMDKAAAGFKGMTADLSKTTFTAIIKETTVETGSIALLRPKPKDLRMLVNFAAPEQRSVEYADKKLRIYYPKMQTVQAYDLGKQSSLLEQFLLLGFGTPGKDLASNYAVKSLGEETIAGTSAAKLELTPKSKEALDQVKKLEIWVSNDTGQPIQQKIYQTSRDTVTITYSNEKVNPPLTAESVKLKLPAGVKTEYPQK
jgi:outer membrane lipoprotein-sorting protein